MIKNKTILTQDFGIIEYYVFKTHNTFINERPQTGKLKETIDKLLKTLLKHSKVSSLTRQEREQYKIKKYNLKTSKLFGKSFLGSTVWSA